MEIGSSAAFFEEMLQVTLALPSGHCTCLSILESSKVEDLKTLAQESLQKRHLQLVTAGGCVLTDRTATLQASGLQDGDQLTAIVRQTQLAAAEKAFAFWCCGGDGVVTWGKPDCGGDSSAVQDQLEGVQQVQATAAAFAAVLQGGFVVS